MTEAQVLETLSEVQAVITNSHVVYTSGKHGSAYVNKDAVYPHTRATSSLCHALAVKFADAEISAVIAPAVGGVILSQWVAYHLSEIAGREVLGLYAEKAENGESFVLKRGYDKLVANKRTLVVEDVLTTGGSARKVIEATRAAGGQVVGLGVLCNRGAVTLAEVANPPTLFALANVTLDSWDESECPLCAKGVPINTDVGKGREFLAKRKSRIPV